MKFLKQYRDHKIQESSNSNEIKFFLAYPQIDGGYGGLDMVFKEIDEIDKIPVGNYPDLELWDDPEDHDSDMYGKVYLMASDEDFPHITGQPGYIPQQSDLEDLKDRGMIEYWAPIDDIDDIGAALGELYDTDYTLAAEFFKVLGSTKFGQSIIKNAADKEIITPEELESLKTGTNLLGYGFFD
jgi:hypothetical protein